MPPKVPDDSDVAFGSVPFDSLLALLAVGFALLALLAVKFTTTHGALAFVGESVGDNVGE